MKRGFPLISGIACVLALAAGAQARPTAAGPSAEVVVTFSSPPLSRAHAPRRVAADRIAREQARFERALGAALPSARVRWRYRIVLNGVAVVVPLRAVAGLRLLPGVRHVEAGATYGASRDTVAAGRAGLGWAPGLENQGAGMKIGIIDDGVDQRHPFFNPAGYAMPPGFPRGQRAYTTAKVIVARAFPPPGSAYANAGKPFDAGRSSHGTHVAGIAAGNAGTVATGGRRLSGVAPRAYIGNYKALTVPTDAGVGLDGNAAEIVAAIEAAVADGMDVINLSIGEPEVEPSRDLVALALDGAADAGVVPVVAAGNDFGEFGRGSLASPGSAAKAITVAAVTSGEPAGSNIVADFSSSGPTTLSLRLKPDVSAPGVGILSSVPGGWQSISGTSMASPHVAGAAALLRERHPDWSVAQLKAALISTGDTTLVAPGEAATPLRGGGGVIDLLRADRPLVLAAPASLSLGLVRSGTTTAAAAELEDAGGGPGEWAVAVEALATPAGTSLSVPATVAAPGRLELSATVAGDGAEGDATGFVELTRGSDVRRIPYWFRVTRPALQLATARRLETPGTYAGSTKGRAATVSTYRYPEVPAGAGVTATLAGPEQVFRLTLEAPVANFGVVITQRARGVRVEPRVVAAGDENRLTGYAALPLNLNPYLAQFGDPVPAAGAVRPLAGTYDVVFDSATRAGAGAFRFRFWIDDTTPPAARLERARVRRGTALRVRLADAGSGVDPSTLTARIDGARVEVPISGGVARIATASLAPGRHRLRLQVSDYQESRNTESVPPILPNTRVLTAAFVVLR
ncbi:Subtilase family [Gaiella occulta]|uniref:Subtilase family n=1 Tax=Gaiella occulta TaxID=1002870 RepID=A0A7M2YYS6_9ACTN|nr:S8 family serine peptidase [Gaiella occulta]RDI75256.1 Subtilase family [Gaiella occulta]